MNSEEWLKIKRCNPYIANSGFEIDLSKMAWKWLYYWICNVLLG